MANRKVSTKKNIKKRYHLLAIICTMVCTMVCTIGNIKANLGDTYNEYCKKYGDCIRDSEGIPEKFAKIITDVPAAQASWKTNNKTIKVSWLAPSGSNGGANALIIESINLLNDEEIREILFENSQGKEWKPIEKEWSDKTIRQNETEWDRSDGGKAYTSYKKIMIEDPKAIAAKKTVDNKKRLKATKEDSSVLITSFKVALILFITVVIVYPIYKFLPEDLIQKLSNKLQSQEKKTKKIKKEREKERQAKKINLKILHKLEWRRFEQACEEYLKLDGWITRRAVMPKEKKREINILALKKMGKEGEYIVMACQCLSSLKKAGQYELRKLKNEIEERNSKEDHEEKDLLPTYFSLSGFTPEAEKYATKNKIKIVNGEEIVKKINQVATKSREELITKLLRGDYDTPTCPECLEKMTLKKGSDTLWRCKNFYECHQEIEN